MLRAFSRQRWQSRLRAVNQGLNLCAVIRKWQKWGSEVQFGGVVKMTEKSSLAALTIQSYNNTVRPLPTARGSGTNNTVIIFSLFSPGFGTISCVAGLALRRRRA